MMDVSLNLCEKYHINLFELFNKNTLEVIPIIDFFIEKGLKKQKNSPENNINSRENDDKSFWSKI